MVEGQRQQHDPLHVPDLARVLFQRAGEALLLVEPLRERVLDANPAAQRLTGLSGEQLRRLSVRDLVAPAQGARDWLDTVRQTGTFDGRDHFLLRTDRPDVRLPVGLTVARLPSEAGPLALVTVRDRREQAELQGRLGRLEAELRQVLLSASDCLWSCRIDAGRWRHRYLSPVVERLTGRPVAFFLDRPEAWAGVVVPEDLPRWREHLGRVTAGQSNEVEFRARRPDGTVVCLRERVTAAPAEGGLVLHGALGEVIPPKQPEPERRPPEGVGALAGGLAHDFNNLLTGVLGHAELARRACPDDSPARPHLQQIEAASLEAAELCEQLLAYAGKGRFVPAPLDLNALVEADREPLRRLAAGAGTLTFELAPRLPAVPADAAQLIRVVRSLVSNAAEALAGGGGWVRVATAAVRLDRPAPGAGDHAADLPAGDYVALEVSDNGPGMTADVRARLFEPFFSTRSPGRGLGLAAVRGIVRRHRGSVRVESEPGRGTTVRVLLPCAGPAAAPASWPAAGQGAGAGEPALKEGGAILLADDDAAVREAVGMCLEAMGYRVVSAVDGQDALEKFRRHAGTIRAAVLDVTMPGLSGPEALRELRRLRADLPAVMMSGYTEAAVPEGEGPTGFLPKPFQTSRLCDLLRRLASPSG